MVQKLFIRLFYHIPFWIISKTINGDELWLWRDNEVAR